MNKLCYKNYNSINADCSLCEDVIYCSIDSGRKLDIGVSRAVERILLYPRETGTAKLRHYVEGMKCTGSTYVTIHTDIRSLRRKWRSLPGYEEYMTMGRSFTPVSFGLRCTSPFILSYICMRSLSQKGHFFIHDFHSAE